MATLYSIQKQIADLEKQAEAIRKSETSAAAAKVKELIARHSLTAEDVGLAGKPGKKPAAKKTATATTRVKTVGAAKYRDQKTGKTWTGNGKPPGWIAGKKNRGAFLISAQGEPAIVESAPTSAPVKKASIRKAVSKKTVTAAEVAAPAAEVIKAAALKKAATRKTAKAVQAAAPVAAVKKAMSRKTPSRKAAATVAAASAGGSSDATVAPASTGEPTA